MVVVLAVLVPVSSAGSASPGPQHAERLASDIKPAPELPGSKPPTYCLEHISKTAIAASEPFGGGHNDPACGSIHNDSMRVTDAGGPGTQIWGGPGSDAIDAQNRKIDEIWGDGGDTAKIDACLPPNGAVHDTIHGIAPSKVKLHKVKCQNVKPSTRKMSDAKIAFPFDEPLIDCTTDSSGQFKVTVAHNPVMRAFDTTANVDWQTVAFSALLYEWHDDASGNGTWDLVPNGQSPWYWDRAPDDQLDGFTANLWRPFGKGLFKPIYFTPHEKGRYRVWMDYHWYATDQIGQGEWFVNALFHFDHFANPSLGECDFPGALPPDANYSGTTDEGRTITFDTKPIWVTKVRAVGGTRVLDLKFNTSMDCGPQGIGTWAIGLAADRWIQLAYDNTFSYAATVEFKQANLQNAVATFSITGKINPDGSASGTVRIWDISFISDGVPHTCAGKPHSWTAKATG